MAHYHEVYFNPHTNDGPRVGATRRLKSQIVQERIADKAAERFVIPDVEIVRCKRPDSQCPWGPVGE